MTKYGYPPCTAAIRAQPAVRPAIMSCATMYRTAPHRKWTTACAQWVHCEANHHNLVINTVTTFGHQNGQHIWSLKRGPHMVSKTRTKFVVRTVTTFGHQNGNPNNAQKITFSKTMLRKQIAKTKEIQSLMENNSAS